MTTGELLELSIDERLDQAEVMRFALPATSAKAYLVAVDAEIRWRDRRFTITEVEEERQGSRTVITVEAEALWYRLRDITYVGTLALTDVTPLAGLTTILAGTGWSSSSSPELAAIADVYNLEADDLTILDLVRRWAKITNLDVVFDTVARTVNLTANRGADLGLAFRYRRNLHRLRRRTRPPDVTVLYPYGADDLTIAGVNAGSPYLENFTWYTGQGIDLDAVGADGRTNRQRYTRSRVWSDTSFIVDTELLAAATDRLADQAQGTVIYELGVLDLTELVPVDRIPRIGDRCRVADPDFATDLTTTVVRVVQHPLEPWRNVIELAHIPNPIRDITSSSTRSNRQAEWVQLVGPVSALYQVRNDGDYTIARIPIAVRQGGRANYHLDVAATGVGSGIWHVEVYDAEAAGTVFDTLDIPYTNGEVVRAQLQWAAEDLLGAYDYRVRVTTTADGGPQPSAGVNIPADNDGEAAFWIMAQGAIRETPTAANSVRYDYTGSPQEFTVPDNVTEVRIEAHGAAGGGGGFEANGGQGGKVVASFPVIPGTIYDVIVGRTGKGASGTPDTAYPNGGQGGDVGSDGGAGGGGSSDVRPTGGGIADALIVAAGGGGAGEASVSNRTPHGGDGGFYAGTDGTNSSGSVTPNGATQFAGGSGSGGTAGSFGQGGDGADSGSAFNFGGGGGGGGWYGGEGGTLNSSGGGGGSGWVDFGAGAFDIELADGENGDDGYVVISWDDPA